MQRLFPIKLLLLVVVSASFQGCETSEPFTVVSGVVQYQQATLDRGSLRFYKTGSQPIGSIIESDGSYTVELPAGDYRVSVSYPPPPPPEGKPIEEVPSETTSVIPARYTQPDKSELKVSVKPSQEPFSYNITLD